MKKFKVGLQLYSVHDEMEKDVDATLKWLKKSDMIMWNLSVYRNI